MAMTGHEFNIMVAGLNSPPSRVVSPSELIESLCPHTPLDDEEWPAPKLLFEAKVLLRRLPHRQQVICGLTLAEMVRPVWEEWAVGHADLQSLGRSIEALWRWVNGEGSTAELLACAVASEASADMAMYAGQESFADGRGNRDEAGRAFIAKSAAEAVDQATYVAYSTLDPSARAEGLIMALNYAARAVAYKAEWSGSDRIRTLTAFMRHWWARCRCRLAFFDAATAELNKNSD